MDVSSFRLLWVLGLSLICQIGSAATHTLTINTNGNGSVSRNPTNAAYPNGSVVTLTALPASGWTFSSWSGDATGTNNPLNVTMDADKVITANFSAIPNYTLTVNVSGEGSVTPPGGSYPSNTFVNLSATPSGGSVFHHWSGDASGNANPLGVTMNSSKTVTAHFVKPPTITVQPTGVVVNAGATANFSVSANGDAPLSYQWFLNSALLSGAASSGLTLSNVQSSQAGDYRVVVINPYGSATSQVATLTVICPGTNIVTVCSDAALREAVAIGGHVRFCCNGTITVTNTITVTKDVTLDAAGQNVTISGGNAVRLFTINSGVLFQATNLFFADGGNASGGGAAFRNQAGTLRLVSCVLSNHVVSGEPALGGAVYSAGGATDLQDCRFVNNRAASPSNARGGAIYSTNGSLSIVRSLFLSNTVFCSLGSTTGTSAGGALFLDSTLANVFAADFFGNSATTSDDPFGSQAPAYVFGGAIFVRSGTVSLDHVQLIGNAATGGYSRLNVASLAQGGAIYNGGLLRIKASRISENAAVAGGGLTAGRGFGGGLCNVAVLTIAGATIDHNFARGGMGRNISPFIGTSGADSFGGGLYDAGGNLSITNCTLTGNTSAGGDRGGADVAAGSGYGGGVFLEGGSSWLYHVTIASNTVQGGLAYTGSRGFALGANYGVTNASATLFRSIFAGVSNNVWGGPVDGGYNISSDGSANFSSGSSFNFTDPKLAPLVNNGGPTPTMALLPISPAIDLVPPAGAPPTDQRGLPRPFGTGADVGAFEAGNAALPPLFVRRTGTSVTLSFQGTAGFNYRIEHSDDLLQWEFQSSTGVLGASGPITQTIAANQAQQFYRLTLDF